MAKYQNIALYGAGGDNIGKYIIEALIKESYTVTILARQSSTSKYHPSAQVARISDGLLHAELVSALKGQDVVISAVGFEGTGSQTKVIDAAIEAGVKRFYPTEYGLDNADPNVLKYSPPPQEKYKIQQYLERKVQEHPEFSWTGVATGIWLEWALKYNFLSINISDHTVSYWNDGTNAPSYSTLPYAAQGVVACLKYPDETKNKRVFLEAGAVSQREMVAELEKQQGVTYTVKESIEGIPAVEAAHQRWESSGGTAIEAAYTTITALILTNGFGAEYVQLGKPMVESFASLPKVTLEEVVRAAIKKD